MIVTTSMPKDLPASLQFGQYEEVWLTPPAFAPALAQALRQERISAHKQKLASANCVFHAMVNTDSTGA